MEKTLTESQLLGIKRAYDDGVTLQAISILFKINQHDIINLVHAFKCGQHHGTS